jgi:hypothetical protein
MVNQSVSDGPMRFPCTPARSGGTPSNVHALSRHDTSSDDWSEGRLVMRCPKKLGGILGASLSALMWNATAEAASNFLITPPIPAAASCKITCSVVNLTSQTQALMGVAVHDATNAQVNSGAPVSLMERRVPRPLRLTRSGNPPSTVCSVLPTRSHRRVPISAAREGRGA